MINQWFRKYQLTTTFFLPSVSVVAPQSWRISVKHSQTLQVDAESTEESLEDSVQNFLLCGSLFSLTREKIYISFKARGQTCGDNY